MELSRDAPIRPARARQGGMGWESRTWQCTGLLRNGPGPKAAEHWELWRELCAALERVAQDPRYAEVRSSGDGVPEA